jgi:DNA (cytosine-5)-methyltransferase 1
MRELHLFAGAGGGILGGMLLGHTCVCAVEIEPYCRNVLLQRQRDGILPKFPIWDDVTTFDGNPWRGFVDVVCGGFPCQDISSVGKGVGIRGERSGLWSEFARIIGEIQPRFVWVENSPMLTVRGLGVVLGDLSTMGYDARWGVVSAFDAGAPHQRDRIWILAHAVRVRSSARVTDSAGRKEVDATEPFDSRQDVADSEGQHGGTGFCEDGEERDGHEFADGGGDGETGNWWAVEPNVGRVAHGVAHRVDRLKAIGNGQVCAVVKLAWEILSQG